MAKKGRVLVALYLDGNAYQPNELVEFSDKTAKALEKEGYIDCHPEAVSYCEKELGETAVSHGVTDDEIQRIADAAEDVK